MVPWSDMVAAEGYAGRRDSIKITDVAFWHLAEVAISPDQCLLPEPMRT
jgi:hypothetical protein